MKIRQNDMDFVPVTITLESQKEVDALYAIIGRTLSGDSGLDLYQWYIALEQYVLDEGRSTIQAEIVSNGLRLEVR